MLKINFRKFNIKGFQWIPVCRNQNSVYGPAAGQLHVVRASSSPLKRCRVTLCKFLDNSDISRLLFSNALILILFGDASVSQNKCHPIFSQRARQIFRAGNRRPYVHFV